ncbi:EF-hand domain-containing protein [Streptomyces fulvorobeus]|uniref:Ca2+-binding EF-hand superfamily protein n=1 Tax=Streptomyces fulvorobeus TaxID=284028 RepID=A0A7J0CGS1_9ACTN|nr:EF-hand domain-containing protein [Streptomyces fulvorobeus]NYE44578.1 Ca2+-binding EF-hand superfamily protein [Streptomyces fulvorobeus]GFN01114.1 calcium-binding protein [Streptomyces fulvorobeus]
MRSEAVNRVKLVFTLLDANGNGVLDSDDFDLMSSRVAAAVPGADEARKQAMRAGFTRFWNTLAGELDTRHDGKITYDEYQACVLSPERFTEAIHEFAAGFARLGDLDRSGTVTRPVFTDMLRGVGFELPNIQALFQALGPDDADRVGVDVWETEIRNFYAPDKGGIPADLLAPSPAA